VLEEPPIPASLTSVPLDLALYALADTRRFTKRSRYVKGPSFVQNRGRLWPELNPHIGGAPVPINTMLLALPGGYMLEE